MRVSRLDLLAQLDSVSPGLSPRDIVEQSSCFIFREGRVITYNDEVSCSHPTMLDKLEGAVPAAPLLAILAKLPEDEIEITAADGELIIKGKRRTAKHRMEAEITLPIEHVDKPGKFAPLHEEFGEAVKLVSQCASRDQSQYELTCVHITPKYVEAMDMYQIIRYKMKTGVTEPTLIRSTSIKHLANLGVTKFNMTDTWAHFKNANGLIFSCRRSVNDYKDGSAVLNQTGSPLVLPKGLAAATEIAQVFSSENVDDEQVLIDLRSGKLKITGEGSHGKYYETKKVKYDGEPLSFRIVPSLLIDLSNRHNECEVTADILKVNGGKFVYVTSLGISEEEDAEDAKETPAETE